MKIAFHGAAGMVTGSKHLLSLKDGRKILFDCGLFQGAGKQTAELNQRFGFEAGEVTYLLLSHAHIDHSGLIPKLVKEGFKGRIFCTPATRDLSAILLEDSAIIQRDDTKFINKRRAKQNLPLYEPLYTPEDVVAAMDLFETIEYDNWVPVDKGIEVMFTEAGHIIGSAAVHVRISEEGKTKQVSFSGDVGRYRDIILRSPAPFPQADYIILESTYGDSLHDGIFSTQDDLLKWINRTCVEKKGKLIIPAFSVGRTQELLYFLNHISLEGNLRTKVYVDSPLSMEATAVVKQHSPYFNKRIKKLLETDADPFDFRGLQYIESADESKALNLKDEPCIIISASGMADAGRVKHHIKNNIEKPETTILIVGYCEPESLGGKLMNGAKKVKIFGEEYEVKAEVGTMRSMSAHGDYEDLTQFLSQQNTEVVEKLFLVHGEAEVITVFAEKLRKKNFREVIAPALHESFNL